MELVEKTLGDLVGSISRTIESTKGKILPPFRRYGIKSLPDEVLAKFFLMFSC